MSILKMLGLVSEDGGEERAGSETETVRHIVAQLDNLQQLPLEDLLAKRYQRLMSYGT